MEEKVFSKGEAINSGWLVTKNNMGFLLLVLVISGIMYLTPAILSNLMAKSSPVLAILHSVISWILQIVLFMGLTRIYLMLHDGNKPSLETLFSCIPLFFKFLITELIYSLILLIGLLLFIVPGVIWGVRFSLAKFIVVDKGIGPIQALRLSSMITRGHKKDLLVFYLLLLGLNILGLLALLAGFLITWSVSMFATVAVYRKLLISYPQDS